MEFKLLCNLCKQTVKGDPFKHLRKFHRPIEFFTLYPDIEWDDFEEEIEEDDKRKLTQDEWEKQMKKLLKKRKKEVEEEEDDEED